MSSSSSPFPLAQYRLTHEEARGCSDATKREAIVCRFMEQVFPVAPRQASDANNVILFQSSLDGARLYVHLPPTDAASVELEGRASPLLQTAKALLERVLHLATPDGMLEELFLIIGQLCLDQQRTTEVLLADRIELHDEMTKRMDALEEQFGQAAASLSSSPFGSLSPIKTKRSYQQMISERTNNGFESFVDEMKQKEKKQRVDHV
jgi:hypothetical protein